jgi:hypothetical protein
MPFLLFVVVLSMFDFHLHDERALWARTTIENFFIRGAQAVASCVFRESSSAFRKRRLFSRSVNAQDVRVARPQAADRRPLMTNVQTNLEVSEMTRGARRSWTLMAMALTGGLIGTASAQDFLPLGVSSNQHAYFVEHAYTAESDISQGRRELGDISTFQQRYSYVYSSRPSERPGWETGWRLGAAVESFTFESPSRAPIPDYLGSVAARLGLNQRLSKRWSMTFEAQPGLYSDFEDISGDDFNVPFGAGVMFNQNRDLQWLVGLRVNLRSDYPITPAAGIRWAFADRWTLLLGAPRTRLEFSASDRLALFVGGDVQGGTYTVAEDFGKPSRRRDLDGETVEYREIRIGLGARYQFSKNMGATFDFGWMTDRRFEFDDEDLLLNGDGAGFVRFGVSGSF